MLKPARDGWCVPSHGPQSPEEGRVVDKLAVLVLGSGSRRSAGGVGLGQRPQGHFCVLVCGVGLLLTGV